MELDWFLVLRWFHGLPYAIKWWKLTVSPKIDVFIPKILLLVYIPISYLSQKIWKFNVNRWNVLASWKLTKQHQGLFDFLIPLPLQQNGYKKVRIFWEGHKVMSNFKWKIFSNFVAFSEYPNFTICTKFNVQIGAGWHLKGLGQTSLSGVVPLYASSVKNKTFLGDTYYSITASSSPGS